jgi:Flp pilus assembly secretin CpaC
MRIKVAMWIKVRLTKMKSRREWCELIGWTLAAGLLAMQARFVNAAEAPAGAAISINRGETYVIKGASPDSRPEVKSIDNPNALIVNVQPDGSVMVLGAAAGVEEVRVKMADGHVDLYTVTVTSDADPAHPLASGEAPPAITDGGLAAGGGSSGASAAAPLDPGTGPAATGSSPSADPAGASPYSPAAPSAALSHDSMAMTPPSAPGGSGAAASASGSAAARTTNDPDQITGTFALGNTNAPGQMASPRFGTDPRSEALREASGEVVTHGTHYLPDDAITMMYGMSKVYDFPQRLRRVSIADTSVADLQVINPHQLMLIGHKPGFTTLAVWDNQGNYEERQVRIEQTGHQQVLLNCTVAELDRSRIENYGINWTAAIPGSGLSVVGLPGAVATQYTGTSQLSSSGSNGSTSGGILPLGGQLIPLLLSTNLTYGLAYDAGNFIGTAFFQYLEQHQLGRILAEPHLLANSGQEAKFLEGGEIPIVISQALNTTIVFKEYGTSVVFIPTVVGKRDIELVVKPEVSQPDYAAGVQLFGFTVPAFVTRRADTVVRMKENQTLIIAGLLQHQKTQTVDKVPYLGDIPWLGTALFSVRGFQDTKSELVMSVTPQIVGALPPGAEVEYPAKDLTAEDIRTQRVSTPDTSRPRF